ncbi:MAG: NUDIX hydrolase [Rubrivivax sp.]|nr:MAG: NUDIX hydrolase [Rubrivivax sp.]
MPFPSRFKHCPDCGHAVEFRIPPDDNRERAVCPACGMVHYQNPLNVVGTLPVWEADGRVLLCRRAIEPRYGLWTLPGGFMELGETTLEGALRETQEEAGADVEMGPLFSMLNVVRVGQVHLFYLARLRSLDLDPGPESLEAKLFAENEIPWDEIAFKTSRETLRCFFEDRRAGRAPGLHTFDIA